MNSTFVSSILSAMVLASTCALTGCITENGIEESEGARVEEPEAAEGDTAEAEQALDDPTAPDPGNIFRLKVKHQIPLAGTRMCLEPAGARDASGAIAGVPVYQRACTSGPPSESDPQSFTRLVTATGAIRLQHVESGLYLYIASGNNANGGMAVLLPYTEGRTHGTFAEGALDGDGFRSLTVVNSTICLAMVGAGMGDFVGLYQYGLTCNPAGHQKFHFDYNDASTP